MLGVDTRTTEEIKNKWKNLCSTAKSNYNEIKKSVNKTGGGPTLQPLSEDQQRIVDIFRGKLLFKKNYYKSQKVLITMMQFFEMRLSV